jgi:tetratricopeptide (TPR) repeat protein
MIQKVKLLLVEARKLRSDLEARSAAIALTRIILQHACITLAEWCVVRRRSHPQGADQPPLPLEELRCPADGTLVSSLAELLVAAENDGWNGISRLWWAQLPTGRPCSRLSGGGAVTLEEVLKGFVSLRNDGVEGHGIPGDYDREAELDVVELAAESLSGLLPTIAPNGKDLQVQTPGVGNYTLKLLRADNSKLLCYRKIQRVSAGRCSVRAQVQRSLFKREEIVYEAEDVLSASDVNTYPRYAIANSSVKIWSPFVLLPERLTSHFTGRERELAELREWMDDSGSRACLLYGDGGIGKTTLAIEFVHRVLEGRISTAWHPELITFYTAKLTRWGLSGLEVIRAREVGVLDVGVAIVRGFEDQPLGREWFSREPYPLIQKVASYLNDFGIDRNLHLLILDNTETMATNDEDVKALASQVQELSKRVGRVILTSRRREPIEAHQIEIKPFDDEESVHFLRVRGEDLRRQPILQAGTATLRQYARRLGNKPLVLEVFVQALGEQGISLERAFDRVLRMQRQDLGEFLYTDAWNRLSDSLRHLLLLMTQVSDVHDEVLLKLCCMQVAVGVIEATDALEESRGIARLSTVSGRLQIAFSPEFMKYCENRKVMVGGCECPTKQSVDTVKRRYNEFIRSSTTKIRDRVDRAFRHAFARAAWSAYQEGRFDDCELFYEEAAVADGTNGWLFDRYAYFLFSRYRYDEALEKAKRATQLIPADPEAWFTRGMIEARLVLQRQMFLVQ